jgi:protein SCO1/2
MIDRLRRPLGDALVALLALAAAGPAAPLAALPPDLMGGERPAQEAPAGPLSEVGFDQRLGEAVPLDLPFRDETGRELALGELFGKRPVVLAFVYHSCPMLCTMIQNSLAAALKPLRFTPGQEFDVVLVSFDPRDTPESAAKRKAEVLARYGRAETAAGWHFLVGGPESIRALTAAAGFRYAFDEKTGQFAHASGVLVLTPEGRLARYLYGIEYAPKDLRLAVVEAADGRIGGFAEQLLLLCFHYDANLGKYSAVSMLALRVAAALTVVAIAFVIGAFLRRDARARRAAAGGLA